MMVQSTPAGRCPDGLVEVENTDGSFYCKKQHTKRDSSCSLCSNCHGEPSKCEATPNCSYDETKQICCSKNGMCKRARKYCLECIKERGPSVCKYSISCEQLKACRAS